MVGHKKNKEHGFWNTLFRSFALGSKLAFSFRYWKSLPHKFMEALTPINFLYSIKVAIACVLSYAVAELLGLEYSLWAPLATLMVMQVHMSTSLELTLLRLFGTLVGVIFGLSLAAIVPPTLEGRLIALAIVVPICAFMELWEERFKTAGVTAVFVLLLGHNEEKNVVIFGLQRLLELGLGSVMALLVSMLLWPASAATEVQKIAKEQFMAVADMIEKMTSGFLQHENEVSHRNMFQLLNQISNNTQKFYQIRKYELAHIYREYPLLPHSVRLLDELRMYISTMMDSMETADDADITPDMKHIIEEVTCALVITLRWLSDPQNPPPKPLRPLVEDRAIRFATVRNAGMFRSYKIDEVVAVFSFYNGLTHAAQGVALLQERILYAQGKEDTTSFQL